MKPGGVVAVVFTCLILFSLVGLLSFWVISFNKQNKNEGKKNNKQAN